MPPTVTLVTQTFGAESGLVVYGWVFAAHQIGAATAAVGAGAIRDHLDSYNPAFLVAGLLCLIAALGVFGVRGPARRAPASGGPRRRRPP